MKFLGMGGFEFVIILIVVLLIFGPKNIPKLGKALGKGLSGLRKGVESGKEKIDEKFDEVEEEKAAEAEVIMSSEQDPGSGDDVFEPEEAAKVRRVRRVVKTQTAEDETQ